MSLIEILLRVAGTSVLGLCLYAAGGGYIPFLAALGSVRLSEAQGETRLRLMDAAAMSTTGGIAWALPGLAAPFGWIPTIVAAAVVALLWTSFRLRVSAFADRTVIERRILWRLRYLRVSHPARARLVVDGWGDWADPEALVLHAGEGVDYEIGWSDRTSGDKAQRLADQFNAQLDAST